VSSLVQLSSALGVQVPCQDSGPTRRTKAGMAHSVEVTGTREVKDGRNIKVVYVLLVTMRGEGGDIFSQFEIPKRYSELGEFYRRLVASESVDPRELPPFPPKMYSLHDATKNGVTSKLVQRRLEELKAFISALFLTFPLLWEHALVRMFLHLDADSDEERDNDSVHRDAFGGSRSSKSRPGSEEDILEDADDARVRFSSVEDALPGVEENAASEEKRVPAPISRRSDGVQTPRRHASASVSVSSPSTPAPSTPFLPRLGVVTSRAKAAAKHLEHELAVHSPLVPHAMAWFFSNPFATLFNDSHAFQACGRLGNVSVSLDQVFIPQAVLSKASSSPMVELGPQFRLRVRVCLIPRRGESAVAEQVWTATSARQTESVVHGAGGGGGGSSSFVPGYYFSFKRARSVFPLSTSHSFLAMEVVDDTDGAGRVLGHFEVSLHALRDVEISEAMINQAPVMLFGSCESESYTVDGFLRRFYAGPNGDRPPAGFHWHDLAEGAASVQWTAKGTTTPRVKRQPSVSAFSTSSQETSEASDDGTDPRDAVVMEAESTKDVQLRPGWLCLRTVTHERTLSLLAPYPLENFEHHPEDTEVSPDSMRASYTRIVAVIAVIKGWKDWYNAVWRWEDPRQTSALAVAILFICIFGDMEYFTIYLLLIPMTYLTVGLWNRINGRFVSQRIQVAESGKARRRIATLRIAVLRANVSNMAAQLSFSRDPLCAVYVSYLDDGPGNEGFKHRVGRAMAPEATHTPDFQNKRDKEATSTSARSMVMLSTAISHLREQAKAMLADSPAGDALRDVMERWQVERKDVTAALLNEFEELIAHDAAGSDGGGSGSGGGDGSVSSSSGVEIEVNLPPTALLAFKYPVLQPVDKVVTTSGPKERAMPWGSGRSSLQLDLFHEGKAYSKPLARCTFPLARLVTDEKAGGPQDIQYLVLPLNPVRGSDLNTHEPPLPGLSRASTMSYIEVVAQLILPDNKSAWTQADAANQETLEGLVEKGYGEKASATSASVLAQFRKARKMLLEMQQSVSRFADTLERMKNLLNWTQPSKTAVVYLTFIVIFLICCTVPFRYLFLGWASMKLLKGYRQRLRSLQNIPVTIDDGDAADDVFVHKELTRYMNLVNSTPSDLNLKQTYDRRLAAVKHYRSSVAHSSAAIQLQALWSGSVFKKNRFSGWSRRFLVVRSGVILMWPRRADAIEGQPATSRMILANHRGTATSKPSPTATTSPSSTSPLDCIELIDKDKVKRLLGDKTSPPAEGLEFFALFGYSSGVSDTLLRRILACSQEDYESLSLALRQGTPATSGEATQPQDGHSPGGAMTEAAERRTHTVHHAPSTPPMANQQYHLQHQQQPHHSTTVRFRGKTFHTADGGSGGSVGGSSSAASPDVGGKVKAQLYAGLQERKQRVTSYFNRTATGKSGRNAETEAEGGILPIGKYED